ncbi:MAG: hypothetical protein ACF8LK_03695 [Phycisphaerales bacterium JB041]
MARRSHTHRSPWEDRFTSPSVETLVAALEPETAGVTAMFRDALGTEHGLPERLEWCGVPWKWSLTYRADRSADAEVLAYLVPNPEAPTVVFRLTHEQFNGLPLRKLSRHVREGLAPTRLVAGICWPEWRYQSEAQAQDLLELFGLLHSLTTSEV